MARDLAAGSSCSSQAHPETIQIDCRHQLQGRVSVRASVLERGSTVASLREEELGQTEGQVQQTEWASRILPKQALEACAAAESATSDRSGDSRALTIVDHPGPEVLQLRHRRSGWRRNWALLREFREALKGWSGDGTGDRCERRDFVRTQGLYCVSGARDPRKRLTQLPLGPIGCRTGNRLLGVRRLSGESVASRRATAPPAAR